MKNRKNIKRISAFVLTAALAWTSVPAVSLQAECGSGEQTEAPARTEMSQKEENAYQKIIAMKEKYPEGSKWGNNKEYKGWTACQAFAFMMSDIGYGENAPYYAHYDFGVLKTGDVIIQTPYTTTSDGASTTDIHAMVVLIADYDSDRLVVAEGNYGGKVHWDAELTISEFALGCGTSVVSRFKYKANHPVSLEKPGKQKKVKYKSQDGYGYFYAAELECSGYQFTLSDSKNFPYTSTRTYTRSSPTNYIYWEGDENVWKPGYVRVRSFNISGGNVSYGKWGKVKKI